MSDSGAKTTCDCGCQGAGPMLTQFLRSLGPSDNVSQHFKAAQLEVMKGLRAFLDEQIAARSSAQPSPTQGTRIPVD